MNKLALIKSENFGTVKCDFYRDEKEIWLTRRQIGEALEYSNPNDAIKDIHNRHKDRFGKFSRIEQIALPTGGTQEMVIYNAKGVYEICRWSRQPKANAFYDWVYEVLESLRKGDTILIEKAKLKQLEIDARLRNAKARQSRQLVTMAEKFRDVLSPNAVSCLISEAAAITCGRPILPKEPVGKTYTATEIGEMVGMSANMIGRIAVANNLKTKEYGMYILDKSPHSMKQVNTFVYNERGRDKLLDICRNISERR